MALLRYYWIVAFLFTLCFSLISFSCCGLRHTKRSLMSWVVVIPKEGRAHVAAPAFFWYDTNFLDFVLFCFFFVLFILFIYLFYFILFIYFFFLKSLCCYTKRRVGATTCAYPSFGMTPSQDIRDLFAWRDAALSLSCRSMSSWAAACDTQRELHSMIVWYVSCHICLCRYPCTCLELYIPTIRKKTEWWTKQ